MFHNPRLPRRDVQNLNVWSLFCCLLPRQKNTHIHTHILYIIHHTSYMNTSQASGFLATAAALARGTAYAIATQHTHANGQGEAPTMTWAGLKVAVGPKWVPKMEPWQMEPRTKTCGPLVQFSSIPKRELQVLGTLNPTGDPIELVATGQMILRGPRVKIWCPIINRIRTESPTWQAPWLLMQNS